MTLSDGDLPYCPNCDDKGWRQEGAVVEICGCTAGTTVLTLLADDVSMAVIGYENIDNEAYRQSHLPLQEIYDE